MNDSKVIKKLDNLKKLRESKHVSQTKLSIDLEVSQELISRYELGSSFPQPNMLIKLAKYFNCSVDYLLGLTDVTTPVKNLISDKETVKAVEFYNKCNSLSKKDKEYLNRFLDFLLENNNNPQGCEK